MILLGIAITLPRPWAKYRHFVYVAFIPLTAHGNGMAICSTCAHRAIQVLNTPAH
jgi:hypothetical protein